MNIYARFATLHESGCFVMPNPWDPGSLTLLVQLGFPAVATTSSGWAWSQGQADNAQGLEASLAHLRQMASHSPVPVNGDFEGGFAIEEGFEVHRGLVPAGYGRRPTRSISRS